MNAKFVVRSHLNKKDYVVEKFTYGEKAKIVFKSPYLPFVYGALEKEVLRMCKAGFKVTVNDKVAKASFCLN